MSRSALLLDLLGEPEIVMLLRPIEIDLSGAHRFERTLHPERADIDVAKDQRDEQNGHDGVHDLRQLHVGDIGSVKRKQQQKPRYRDRDAGRKGKPIDKLLAQVKASGRRMLVLDEAAALLEPFEVDLFEKVVSEEDHDDEDEAGHE